MRLAPASLLGLAAVLSVGVPQAAGAPPGPPDRSAWESLAIVPMPKRIRLTGRKLPLDAAVIVLGAKPSPQDEIGVKWINDHLLRAGGAALGVVSEAGSLPAASLRIRVGTRQSSAAVDRAVAQGLFRLGPNDPGQRGYVIHPAHGPDGVDLYLGGSDPVGALYACVTLAGLLEGQGGHVALREAEVVDWPDFRTVTEGWNLLNPELGPLASKLRATGTPSPELHATYLRAMREHMDRLLGWKISCFNADEMRNWQRLSPECVRAFREVAAYAKARGIHSLLYALAPAVGLRSDFPDLPVRCLTGKGREKYEQYVRCWSMDEPRRITAARLGDFLRESGITDLGFHDWDTGGFLNPANWELRCDECRRRWGDDFVAATVNKHRIYYDEIKRRAPDCRLHFTLYPYNISVLTQETAERYCIEEYGPGGNVPDTARRLRERFTAFWQGVSPRLPDDVTFCIRENVAANVHRFQELVRPHGTFAWYKVGSEQWHTFFDEAPRWVPTFSSGGDDVLFNVSLETFLPLKALAVVQYAWNGQTPGATGWNRLPPEERQEHAVARGELYELVLPLVVRNLFGRRAAPELTEALSLNMAMNHIFDHLPGDKRVVPILTTAEKWQWQADEAEKGCRLLDRLFERFTASGDRLGMSDYAVRRFVYVREVFHCCRAMAAAKWQNMLARELAKAGNLDEARAAVARGRQAVAEGRRDAERLLAQRPEDPLYNARLDHKRRPARWKLYTPENGVDFDVPDRLLAQTEKELPGLAAAGELPAGVVEALAKRALIHAAPRQGKLAIDGRADEPDWQQAVPAEAFFAYPAGRGLARAATRARFLYDDQALYFAATGWLPDGEPARAQPRARDGAVQEDEAVELFLVPPHLGGGYVQFQLTAAGSIADKRVTIVKDASGATRTVRDSAWNAEGLACRATQRPGLWEIEARVPLAALGAGDWRGTWRAAVCRDYKGPSRELSMLMRPTAKTFHDTSAMLRLQPVAEPSRAAQAALAVTGLKKQVRTLDDRVATVLDFGLEVRSSRVLHNVRSTAELYDASGRLHRRVPLPAVDQAPYFWQSRGDCSAAFDQEVTRGAMRVALESDEARAEQWVRLGGWEGTNQVGRLFSDAPGPFSGESGACLQAFCNLPAEIALPGAAHAQRLLDRRRGTIEFWFAPAWPAVHPAEKDSPWQPRHVLVHCGIMRRDHPLMFNTSALTVFYDPAGAGLHFQIANRSYAGWHLAWRDAERRLSRPGWHHLACVWDHDAPAADMLRMYLDGRRLPGAAQVNKPERMGDDTQVELDKAVYALQLGGLNTGRSPAAALFDELRISRTPRYAADFSPAPAPFAPDPDTVALFHFDGNLHGEGQTPEGAAYRVEATAGALEHH